MDFQMWASQLAVPGRKGVRIPPTISDPNAHQLSSCRHDGAVLEIVCRCGAILRVRCNPDESDVVRAIRFALSDIPHDSAVSAAVAS